MPASRCCCLIVALALSAADVRADDAFDEEFTPGVLASYTTTGVSIERIESSPVIEWSNGTVDERLPPGATQVQWKTQLLIRAEESCQLHAHFIGQVDISIDGVNVLDASRADVGWASTGDIPLSFGFREIVIRYATPPDAGRCAIFWSGDTFPLEPLPHHQLFLPEKRPDLLGYERGRDLFESHRCGRCHRGTGEITAREAPPLFHVTTGVELSWFEEKLRDHAAAEGEQPASSPGRMPDFNLTDDEIAALTAWLWHMSQPTNTASVPDSQADREDVPGGEELFHSVGCLACHQFNGIGHADPWDGGDLTHIARRRSPEYIATWLQQPTRLNPQSAMPVIQMTPTERGRIVEYLVSQVDTSRLRFEGRDLRPLPDRDLVEQGRALSHALRCVNCHNIPAQQPEWEGIPTLRDGKIDWSGGCLTPLSDEMDDSSPKRRPDYSQHFSDADRVAIQSYADSLAGASHDVSDFARGQRLLATRNCQSCHDRDGSRGVSTWAGRISQSVDSLSGRSQDLVPPNLTAIGDKLPGGVFDRAVGGRIEKRRLPWLSVRMPRFEHSDADLAALREYLIARDRIPAGAPRTLQLAEWGEEQTPQERELLGRSLVGAGGWSCIACHQVGDYRPKNVALGTRGSDLVGMSERMRPEFFLRWCRSPLRIIPGMEMPSYQRPVAGVLEDDLDLQMATLWEALRSPDFEAPTNPASVEQLLAVQPGSAPVVVRDVFTVAEADGGGYVPRSFAVGFGNGHSLLYDLDRLAVRGWTWGDFARQRAEGKSWFWDLAGTPMATGFVDACELGLVHGDSGEVVLPRVVNGRRGRLIDYVTELGAVMVRDDYVTRDNFVTVRHELVFDLPDEVRTVEMTQRFQPWTTFDDLTMQGIRRTIWLRNLRSDWRPQWQTALPEPQLGSVSSPNDREWVIESDTSEARSELIYQAKLTAPRLPPPPVEPIVVGGEPVQTLPGYIGERLPLPASLMPTALAKWNDALAITSLKGHVYLAYDTDGDGVEDSVTLFEEGLSAPFGLLPDGDSLLVTHKAELLRLTDADGDGRCDKREVVADGWGFTHDYHDWVTGPVRDSEGRLYLAVSSDYAQENRDPNFGQWRGEILRFTPGGEIESIAGELRYPVGLAFDHQNRLFVTDQQGVQNTFNELDLIIPGARYGVPAKDDPERDDPATPAAVHIPHPWTRSVNGLFFLPTEGAWSDHPFAGHAIGCEYNMNFLVRMSLQEVDGQLQGACYEFSRANWSDNATGLLGPISGMATDDGDIYIGALQDSGWLGGLNQGQVIRFTPSTASATNGIREIRATPDGFEIEFISAVDRSTATNPASYSLSGYTRVWEGTYGTEDSGRYVPAIEHIELSDDQVNVRITCGPQKAGFVYDVSCVGVVDTDDEAIFPNVGYYTMNRLPRE